MTGYWICCGGGSLEGRKRVRSLVHRWRVHIWAQLYHIATLLGRGFPSVSEGLRSGVRVATFNREKNLVTSPRRETRGFCGVMWAVTPNREKILANRIQGLLWVGSEVIRKRYSYALSLCNLRATRGSRRGMGCGRCVASSIASVFPDANRSFQLFQRGA